MAQLEQALRLSLQQQGAHCQAIQAAAKQVCWLVLACAAVHQAHCHPCIQFALRHFLATMRSETLPVSGSCHKLVGVQGHLLGFDKLNWVQVPTTAGSVVIPVAKEQVGAVIGSGGSVVKGLQESTGAQISIVEDGNKPSVHVRLGWRSAACLLAPICRSDECITRRSLAARHSNCRTARLRYCRSPAAISGYV